MFETAVYPTVKIKHIEHPNRWYAFPILGFIVKLILTIPIWIMTGAAMIAALILNLINPFVVLFTGHYWDYAYQTAKAAFIINAKLLFYLSGLTDRYPGFNFETNNIFEFAMSKPKAPNKMLAIPLLGLLIRVILLIPFYIYVGVLTYASYIGTFFSSFPVMFQGRYPESTYEIMQDTVRVNLAQYAYVFGLSDHYPSFAISMKHRNIKIALIIAGAILWILTNITSRTNQNQSYGYPNMTPSSTNSLPY